MINTVSPTSSDSSKSSYRPAKAPVSRQMIMGAVALIVLLLGIGAAVILSRQTQELRQQASSTGIEGSTVQGYFDNVDNGTCRQITGWACDSKDFTKQLRIAVYVDTFTQAQIIDDSAPAAGIARADVAAQCGNNGAHGFQVDLTGAKAKQLLGDGKAHKLIVRAVALTGTNPTNYVSDPAQGAFINLPSAGATAPSTVTCTGNGGGTDNGGGGVVNGTCKAVTINGTIAYKSKVSLTCTSITGATRYEFRIKLPNGTIKTINPVAAGSVSSEEFTLDQIGGFKAQCRGCKGAGADTCPPYEQI